MATEPDIEQRQRMNEDSKAVLSGLNQPDENDDRDRAELLDQLTDSDLVAADATLQNLASKDIPSANFSEAEAQEFRHYLDVAIERKRAAHPHPDQDVTGILREVVHDDPEAGLDPVDPRDRLLDDTFRQGVAARMTKGKEGNLLGLALRSIKESVLRRGEQQSSGGGILGRFR